MDFVHDRLVTGQRFKCLTMTDPCSKEVLVIEVDVSIGGARGLIKRKTSPKLNPPRMNNAIKQLWISLVFPVHMQSKIIIKRLKAEIRHAI